MGLKEYREKNTKKLLCPSGEEAVIRRLSVSDFLEVFGTVPGLNIAEMAGGKVAELKPEQVVATQKAYLCRGVVSFAGARVVEVVSDPEKEISWMELSPEDSNFLIAQVSEMTNPAKKVVGGAPEGARFPAVQQDPPDA